MTMEWSYTMEGRVGVFRFSGTRDMEAACESWRRIHAAIERDGLEGVLVLDHARSTLTLLQILDLARLLGELGFPQGLRIAIVDPCATASSNNAFGETVAHNRGWDRINVYRSEASARRWLGLPVPPPTEGKPPA